MGAPRPIYEAYAVWLAVRAEFGFERGVLDGALKEISGRMAKHLLRRGSESSIDCHEGRIIGDALSEEHLAKLFSQANQVILNKPELEAEMRNRAAQLRAELAERPRSYLIPFRAKSAREAAIRGTWVVMLFWPNAPLKERMWLISGRELDWQIMSADDPNGPFASP